jgi:protein-disulfide isomerase
MLGGVLVLAVAVVAVLIAVSSSGSSSPSTPKTPQQASQVANQVNGSLVGIPQAGTTLGAPSAKVTVTEFGDLQCPVCRDFALGSETQLIANEVKSGQVKLVYKSLQTATADPATFGVQQASALAAGKQRKAWNYILLFYHEQGAEGSGYVNSAYLIGLASQIPGFNVNQWDNARTSSSLSNEVVSQVNNGTAHGVTGTPTLIITGPKGSVQPSDAVPPYSELAQDVKQVS